MTDLKLYMEPQYLGRSERADGGIRRVVDALVKYLPEFGIQVVTSAEEADITAGHGTMRPYVQGKPFVSHNHGLMWTDYFTDAFSQNINKEIVDAFVHANAITAPSQWVRTAIGHGILKDVEVLYHGIEFDEWDNTERDYDDYIFWNKARQDAVSDSSEMQELARLLPDLRFVSTLGRPTENLEIIGVHPHEIIKPFVQHAGLYLATTRETFGIGTLEALASGVPVVGWDYGGQREIIRQGDTGYLAAYGDYAGLADCIHSAIRERERLSRNARDDAEARWQWRDKVENYANLYKRVATWDYTPRPKVSVIVPCYNLARFLNDALTSLQQQTFTDFECIIIDDHSTDDTVELAREWVEKDIRFRYWSTDTNRGLSYVRNFGFSKAFGRYVLYLDADDMLPPAALERLANALDSDAGIHIAYGALELLTERGLRSNRFPQDFNWYSQMAHQNQVSTAAMMRREVIETSGGWRERMWRAEDAEFWSRVTSFGFRAKKVTTETTLWYRIRPDSKGAIEFNTYADRDGNWLANIGWRTANSAVEGHDYIQKYPNAVSRPELVPFGAQGQRRDGFWNVHHYEQPTVTVIVYGDKPVDILDALVGQDFINWECFVVGSPIKGFPFARFVKTMEEIIPRANKVIVLRDNNIPTDYLTKQLNVPKEPKSETNDKVLMEYTGNNAARISMRINGRTYLGAQGAYLWVVPEDVKGLEHNRWRMIDARRPIPAPAIAEARVYE